MNYTEHIWGLLDEQDRVMYQSLRDRLIQGKTMLEGAILDPFGNVHVTDMVTCLIWQIQSPEGNRIGLDIIQGHVVSTVFLSHNHNGNYFETMVVDNEGHEVRKVRYKTAQEAKEGHLDQKRLCTMIEKQDAFETKNLFNLLTRKQS